MDKESTRRVIPSFPEHQQVQRLIRAFMFFFFFFFPPGFLEPPSDFYKQTEGDPGSASSKYEVKLTSSSFLIKGALSFWLFGN